MPDPVFLPADLFCVSPLPSDTLGLGVELFETNTPQVPRAAKLFTHIAGADSATTIVEALGRVSRSPTTKYPCPSDALLVLRVKSLTDQQRLDIVHGVCSQLGEVYGGQKILLDFADNILSRFGLFGRDPVVFRKLALNPRSPICSQLWAYWYDRVARWRFCGVDPLQAEPDDVADDLLYIRPVEYQVIFCSPQLRRYLPVGVEPKAGEKPAGNSIANSVHLIFKK
jgi:hypothetical protein